MHLILTHEQADFDAIGALLGAYLVNENAYPVLPRRTNRNVRAFLNLYGPELPFVDAQYLPSESIETITLVDTQSLVTLKGMTANTRVHVIDHHGLREDTSPEWTTSIENLGACTTLFVQELAEHAVPLSTVYTTLLLLGIYEDTGSLTYASTTAADAKAVAALLEMGANLKIAARYLNPPLTNQQRIVYERLLASSKKILIHDKTILVASASAEGMVDEVSSIAHKIRDLLDPDGLFLLVKTDEGIRIVARSTTDQVNVAELAAHFGGGGHDRAAAALVRAPHSSSKSDADTPDAVLEKTYKELIALLPKIVRPPLTVGEIMSPRPQVIAPDVLANEVANLMQKYGYEGYPVVQDGRVIGLLTRRNVDRAVSHKLNLPAFSLMDAGEYSVHPMDPVESLQRVMSASGWGQVPVVDPDTNQLIGIVTRTDLIKTMTPAQPTRGQVNLGNRLDQAMPAPRLALLKMIAAKALELHLAIFIVGGFVRDLLLDLPGFDFDLVVEGDAIHLAKVLSAQFGGKVTSHARFGTAKWNISAIKQSLMRHFQNNQVSLADNLPDSIDFISARIEFYDYPTALPTVERSSIKLDLHRRDFTINTMAVRLDGRNYGTLYDYWGGLRDLHRKIVRVLHSLSFVDDPTRLLRAVRFEQRFGFAIEERTLQLMDDARPLVRQVSGDRIRHELNLILDEDHPSKMLARLETLDLLQPIHPDLNWTPDQEGNFTTLLRSSESSFFELESSLGNIPLRRFLGYLAWLIHYSTHTIQEITDRLRLPALLTQSILAANRLLAEAPGLKDSSPGEITARLDKVPIPALFAVFSLEPKAEVRSLIKQFHLDWRNIHPTLTGEDLRQMGIPPGPHYRLLLSKLRSAWINGDVQNQAAELEYLATLLTRLGSFSHAD